MCKTATNLADFGIPRIVGAFYSLYSAVSAVGIWWESPGSTRTGRDMCKMVPVPSGGFSGGYITYLRERRCN